MIAMRVLPYVIAALQVAAACVYLYHREWRLTIVWAAVSVSNAAFAGIR